MVKQKVKEPSTEKNISNNKRGTSATLLSVQEDKETRCTFILKESTLEKIRHIAYWSRLNQKDVYTAALEEYIAKYEQENGTIQIRKKPLPNA